MPPVRAQNTDENETINSNDIAVFIQGGGTALKEVSFSRLVELILENITVNHLAFTRSDTEPTAPSASEFTVSNSTITAYPSGWSADFGTGEERLWALALTVNDDSVTVGNIQEIGGRRRCNS